MPHGGAHAGEATANATTPKTVSQQVIHHQKDKTEDMEVILPIPGGAMVLPTT